jgi:hypothetical protein
MSFNEYPATEACPESMGNSANIDLKKVLFPLPDFPIK